MREYTDSLKREIKLEYSRHQVGQLETIYFGGGTPSLIAIDQLASVLQLLKQGSESVVEQTIELDPGTFNIEKLEAYKSLGFNRFSMGV